MSRKDETTQKIHAAMTQLGAADARTIAETAQVGYSTAVRKLRGWAQDGAVTRIDRGTDPAHWTLNNPTNDNDNDPVEDQATLKDQPADRPAAEDHAAVEDAEPPSGHAPAHKAADDAAGDPTGDGQAGEPATTSNGARRAKGKLGNEVLSILQAHPDNAYKVSEVCKLIDQRNPGRKASAGAVANALHKFAGDGVLVQTVDKPATFKAV
ncbi:MAG: hypothetical protein ACRD0P_15980 [Stackebrandtia sp.]